MGGILHYGKGYKETMGSQHNELFSSFSNHGDDWSSWKDNGRMEKKKRGAEKYGRETGRGECIHLKLFYKERIGVSEQNPRVMVG